MAEGAIVAPMLLGLLAECGVLLNTPVEQQVQVQVRSDDRLRQLAGELAAQDYYLVTVAANDERELEDRRYKIYYVLSHPSDDQFVIIEYLLDHSSNTYCSIRGHFPAVEPFEREMCDMVGLWPTENDNPAAVEPLVSRGSWLHDAYPLDLFPLRRTYTATQLRERVMAETRRSLPPRPLAGTRAGSSASEQLGMTFPVGPIHAGIIESGQFWFTTAGEVIEDLQLRLGYAHRGIERMFQSYMGLLDGWRLAEQVSGDTSFAHSLAYCRVAEALTNTAVPPAAELLRALFLELERIHNHIADVGGLVEDVGMEQLAAEFSVIREEILRLNKRLTGHRYLRGVNRVGGVCMARPLDTGDVTAVLRKWIGTFKELANSLISRSGFRERTIRIGILTPEEALRLGVTGLAARASGVPRDSRIGHPIDLYRKAADILRRSSILGNDVEAKAGDVFARTVVRAREVLASRQLSEWMVDQWLRLPDSDRGKLAAEPRVLPQSNYTSAIGQAEGCRGDIVYWVMQDKMNGIYRCKVRDPSMLNWPALRACALPRIDDGTRIESLVADFPLLNKSFSLSYAGNDL
jgi:Ni,Fe-hydrogenase III large subunit/Ni,Fe-hydrogenase III component G